MEVSEEKLEKMGKEINHWKKILNDYPIEQRGDDASYHDKLSERVGRWFRDNISLLVLRKTVSNYLVYKRALIGIEEAINLSLDHYPEHLSQDEVYKEIKGIIDLIEL